MDMNARGNVVERACVLEFLKIWNSITSFVSEGTYLGSLNLHCLSKMGMILILI